MPFVSNLPDVNMENETKSKADHILRGNDEAAHSQNFVEYISVQAGDIGPESSADNDNDLSGCGSHVTLMKPESVLNSYFNAV